MLLKIMLQYSCCILFVYPSQVLVFPECWYGSQEKQHRRLIKSKESLLGKKKIDDEKYYIKIQAAQQNTKFPAETKSNNAQAEHWNTKANGKGSWACSQVSRSGDSCGGEMTEKIVECSNDETEGTEGWISSLKLNIMTSVPSYQNGKCYRKRNLCSKK